MSRELIESIISNNMLEANDMVEAKMAEIRERKMFEMKRMFAAKMDEGILGMGLSKQEIEDRRKAGYVEAHKKLSDPRDKSKLSDARKKLDTLQSKKKVNEDTIDEMRAPGEVPGSDERKQDAERLRTVRKGLSMLDIDKKGKSKFYKDYLAARKAQVVKKPSKTSAPAAPSPTTKSSSSISQASTIQTQAQPGQQAQQQAQQHSPAWQHFIKKYNKRKQFQKSGKFKAWKVRQALHNIKQDITSGAGVKRALNSPIMQDLHSLGTRNL